MVVTSNSDKMTVSKMNSYYTLRYYLIYYKLLNK